MGYVCPEMFCPHSKGLLNLWPRSLGQEAAIKILLKLRHLYGAWFLGDCWTSGERCFLDLGFLL